MIRARVLITALTLLILSSCASRRVPIAPAVPIVAAVPETPEIQVLKYQRVLSAVNNAAITTTIQLRDAGKLDNVTAQKINSLALEVANVDKAIAVIMGDGSSWAAQRIQVASLLAQLGLSKLTSDPTIQSAFAQVLDLLHKIEVLAAP